MNPIRAIEAAKLYLFGMAAGVFLLGLSLVILRTAHMSPLESQNHPCPMNCKATQ